MARFSLKRGNEDRDLGKLVLKMAEAAGKNGGKLGQKDEQDFRTQLDDLIDPSFAGKIELVYDTPDSIHIVVPYLPNEVYSDNNLANEAMGHIVIRGCGR